MLVKKPTVFFYYNHSTMLTNIDTAAVTVLEYEKWFYTST